MQYCKEGYEMKFFGKFLVRISNVSSHQNEFSGFGD
jgi:hypothetical protein